MGLEERMFFFPGSGNRRLLGFLHLPGPIRRDFAVLYCPPFAEERNLSHSIAVRTAREMCALGIPVLRFDFSGCGDSEGDLHEATLPGWLQDIAFAAEELRKASGIRRIVIWGLRLGAALGILHGSRDPEVAGYLLWHPAVDLKTFMTQFLRQRVSTQIAAGGEEAVSVKSTLREIEEGGTVEVIGYPINRALLEGFMGGASGAVLEAVSLPTLLASVGPMEQPGDAMLRMEAGIKGRGVPVDLVHVRNVTFWDHLWCWEVPDLTRHSLAWLKNLA